VKEEPPSGDEAATTPAGDPLETKGEDGGVEKTKGGGEEEGDQVLAAMQATADPLPLRAGDSIQWQGAP